MSDDPRDLAEVQRRLLVAEQRLRDRTVIVQHQIERLEKRMNAEINKVMNDTCKFEGRPWTLMEQEPAASPVGACILLDLFLTRPDRDAITGDLQEYFSVELSKYSARRARLLFWTRAFGAIARRNPVCRWVLVTGLTRVVEWILRNLA